MDYKYLGKDITPESLKAMKPEERVQLCSELRDKIINTVSANGGHLASNLGAVELTVALLSVFDYKKDKIDPNLTYAQKADVIRHRYDERMLSQMQEKLNNQTEEEKRQTEKAIQKELDAMSDERREELRKALKVEKLNGEMVRKTFASTAGVTATLIAMESAGFTAYMALTSIMHTIFTMLLGVTLPFAAYTGATTLLSVLTGPVGIAIAGGAELLMINKNKNK